MLSLRVTESRAPPPPPPLVLSLLTRLWRDSWPDNSPNGRKSEGGDGKAPGFQERAWWVRGTHSGALTGSRKRSAILSSVPHRSPLPHLTWSQPLLGAERHVHQRSGLSSGCQILSSLAFPAVTQVSGLKQKAPTPWMQKPN